MKIHIQGGTLIDPAAGTEQQQDIYIDTGKIVALGHAPADFQAAKTIEGDKVVAHMAKAPIDDPLFGTVVVRKDGRAVHNMYVFEVKSPAESKGPSDDYKLLQTIPAEQAFRPLKDGGCPLVN